MASEKSKKKKEIKPLKTSIALIGICVAFVAMALFLIYIINPPANTDNSDADYSGTQSFGEESKNDPSLELGSVKDRLSEAEVLDIVVFGKYEQDGDSKNGKEGIEWIVLENKDGKLLLISRNCLDTAKFNDSRSECSWQNSSLRNWLNSDFASEAFSESELGLVSETIHEGSDLSDRIFVPSKSEVLNYLGFDSWRSTAATDHASSKGARVENGRCWWWLRDEGSVDSSAAYVHFDGSVRENGFAVDYDQVGVRPMIYVDVTENA